MSAERCPGSISVDARTLYEEGSIINPTYLFRRGEFVTEVISVIASNSRTPVERKGDLKAQVAANITGERRVLEIIAKYGLASFGDASKKSFEYGERMMKARLTSMLKGTYHAVDYLEHPDGQIWFSKLRSKFQAKELTLTTPELISKFLFR